MKKVLKVLGWLMVPYLMLLVFWKKLNKPARIAGIIYTVIIVISAIVNGNNDSNTDKSATKTVATSSSTSASQPATSDTNKVKTAKIETQTKADGESAAAQKNAADEKETQRSELQALGDWSIKSNSDDFANRYAKIQQYISQGDKQSGYDEATMASKRADDLNSKTMNNQDMKNVPKDIPSDVRDILSGVDSHLAQGYMLKKQGFDDLAEGINNDDLSKINDAKDNFALANDEINQAKSLIDKANNALK